MSSASARVRRHAHRDELADVADLAGGEHRLLRNLEAGQCRHRADRLDAVEIRGGEDAIRVLRRDRYAANARMRERAAHERDVLHAGKTDIGDKLAAAAHEAVVLLAQEPRAYSLFRHANPHLSRRFADRALHSNSVTIARSGRNPSTRVRPSAVCAGEGRWP